MNKNDLMPLVLFIARKHCISPRFLAALVELESSWKVGAMKYERGYIWLYNVREMADALGCSKDTAEVIQKSSWGLVQLMGANFYQAGFCGWPVDMCDPEVNLKYGCEHIRRLIKTQDLGFHEPIDLYAAYNAGSVRKVEGRYVNQSAVTAFKKIYESIPSDFGII